MNQPTPAIVTQAAARRLPRVALLAFCLAYVLPGFLGREAWKSADMTALGYMFELAQGTSHWLHPTLMGVPSDGPALLPYWLGAWAMQLAPSYIPADFAARIPFMLLLVLTMVCTWYGTYYLARSPKAQPVPFAFGGEAQPTEYARAMADGGLLALIACLGLAQLSHETTPALVQLACTALLFYAMGALPYHRRSTAAAIALGLAGLTLSGAPTLAVVYGLGGALVHYIDRTREADTDTLHRRLAWESITIAVCALTMGLAAYALNLWRWKIELPHARWADWHGYAELLIWFTWPAWPLALWAAWRWRRQLFNRYISRHVALPAWLVLVTLVTTLSTASSDRSLLLALPPLAAFAAFALPTLKRQVAALVDWFTLLFFSGCGFTIWVVWIAMQTGIPKQPAANVARLAPGFVASFSWLQFGVAVLATLAWAWLVQWRVGRHRAAIWRSLVLPAGGAALCWLLLMTLWMPLLNYAQSYTALVQRTLQAMDQPGCAEVSGLGQGQIAAFQVYGKLSLKPMHRKPSCHWLLAEPVGPDLEIPTGVNLDQWRLTATLRHPTDSDESVLLLQRK